jgi:hypothetical protein
LRSIASLLFVFVVRARARLDFTFTFHGHDQCASEVFLSNLQSEFFSELLLTRTALEILSLSGRPKAVILNDSEGSEFKAGTAGN